MANINSKTHVLFEIDEIKFQQSIITRLSQHIELKQARVKSQIFDYLAGAYHNIYLKRVNVLPKTFVSPV